jgi:N4-gp56 family major capsid protein
MAGSTSVTLNDLMPQVIQEALFVASERSIMRGLVRNYNVAPGAGKTINVPIYPVQTAAAVTEGNEVSNTEVATDTAQLTVSQVGIRTLVTDLAVNAASSNVVADLGRLFGEAIARKMDQDLISNFASFTTNTVGSTSTTITPALLMQAITKLKNSAVPTDGVVAVLHPAIAYDLKSALTTQGNTAFGANGTSNDIANEAMMEGYVGRLFGIPVYETSNFSNTGAAGDFVGGIFHRDALGLAMMRDIQIETQRRASFLGSDVVCSAMYGHGVIYEGYGVAASFDSSVL